MQRLLKPVFDQVYVISVRFPCLLLPLYRENGRDYTYCYFVYFQILTSVLAVLMTVTVHVLYVQTQWDPLIVHVTVLTLEMAELAIYHQVIRKR